MRLSERARQIASVVALLDSPGGRGVPRRWTLCRPCTRTWIRGAVRQSRAGREKHNTDIDNYSSHMQVRERERGAPTYGLESRRRDHRRRDHRRRDRFALRLLILDAMDREICADHYRDAPKEHDLDHRLVAVSIPSAVSLCDLEEAARGATGGLGSSLSLVFPTLLLVEPRRSRFARAPWTR
jgi:hypothetical protein